MKIYLNVAEVAEQSLNKVHEYLFIFYYLFISLKILIRFV